MADANQLKIEARREEAAGDYEQASRLYREALSAMEAGGDLSDPSLLVRVADLEYRQDDAESALDYYLQAVDEYAEQGLITNAIAVCNKILRVFPDQVDCHRRLADLHMAVGLTAEARQNLIRFAEEAWDPDAPEPVLEAMRSFLDRTPDQEVALQLAERLQDVGREEQALEALRAVWEERSRAEADVDALERKAEEIAPGSSAETWSVEPAGDDEPDVDEKDDADREPAAAGGRWGRRSEPGAEDDREDEPPEEQPPEGAAAGGSTEGAGPEETGDRAADAEWAMGVDVGADGAAGAERPAASAASQDEASTAGSPADEGDGDGPPEPGPAEEEPAEAGRRAGGGNGREPWGGSPPDLPGLSEPALEAGERRVPAPDRELELMASFRDRFTRFRRSSVGGGADGHREEGAERSGEEPRRPAATHPGANATDRSAADAGRDAQATEPGPADSGRGGAADDTQEPADARREPAADTDSETARERDEIMEELNELDRASEISTADPGGWDEEAPGDGDVPSRADAPDEAAAPAASSTPDPGAGRDGPAGPDDQLGEEAELRRGMELVDEMLEVQPENLDLRERKLRYARRLGDREALVEASLELADALAKKDARRSARALYRRVLELDPENQAAESGLARLDVGELEEKRQAGKRAGAAHQTPEAASPEEQEARQELGRRLWTEFENSIREMPWLHAATQAYQATGPDALPPIETFEMLAHYLMARERHRDAARILERALELTDEGDENVTDALYYLGRAHESLGEDERAAEYFDRLARVDPDFARVRDTLSDGDGS